MFLQYGVKDGELIYIDQVGRGALSDVVCPYCRGALVAKKGRVKAPHFAHTGQTCRQVKRDPNAISLPAFDRFDLELKGKDYDALKRFHDGVYYSGKEFERLLRLELVEENPWSRRDELTKLGKIPFGELPLQSFAAEQDRLIEEKHDQLRWWVWNPLNEAYRATAETDLAIFRAQWRRVLAGTLYFLEITHQDGKLYKIGVTHRSIKDRIAEIQRDLAIVSDPSSQFEGVTIKPLRVFQHRGAVELYFKHRYHAYQRQIGSLTEYFEFDDKTRKHVLSDLTRLGDKELSDLEQHIYNGTEPPDPRQEHVTQQAEWAAKHEAYRRAAKAQEEMDAARQGVTVDLNKITVMLPEVAPDGPPDPALVSVPQTVRKAHTRRVELKEYTITCKQCGKIVTLYRYPGRAPTLCSDECVAEYSRERDKESNRERQRRFRERHNCPQE